MIEIEFPAQDNIVIESIVFDFNGTLAVNGVIETSIITALDSLNKNYGVQIYVLTADTYGTVADQLKDSSVVVKIVSRKNGSTDKLSFINQLGAHTCAAVGNGFNDTEMLEKACLSICIMGREGCANEALMASDILVTSVEDAIDLFNNPLRIKATLRQ